MGLLDSSLDANVLQASGQRCQMNVNNSQAGQITGRT
jgi:hypothetical protein